MDGYDFEKGIISDFDDEIKISRDNIFDLLTALVGIFEPGKISFVLTAVKTNVKSKFVFGLHKGKELICWCIVEQKERHYTIKFIDLISAECIYEISNMNVKISDVKKVLFDKLFGDERNHNSGHLKIEAIKSFNSRYRPRFSVIKTGDAVLLLDNDDDNEIIAHGTPPIVVQKAKFVDPDLMADFRKLMEVLSKGKEK